MMKRNVVVATAVAAACFVCPCMEAFAHEDQAAGEEKKTGFSGTVQIGAVLINSNDRLDTNSRNKKIQSFDEKKSSTYFEPAGLFDLSYTTEGGARYYLGTPLEKEPTLALGVANTFGDGSTLDIALIGQFFVNAWKDPYLTGVDREKTSDLNYGAEVKYDRILGTGLKGHYRYIRRDVDQDLIGSRSPDLKRDGDIHTAAIAYQLQFGNGHTVTPGFRYERAAMDGKANSYNGEAIYLDYRKEWNNLAFDLNVSGEANKYRKTHPLFDRRRNDVKLDLIAMLTLMNPFGYEDFSISVGGGLDRQHSNIAFYDNSGTFSFVLVGYAF